MVTLIAAMDRNRGIGFKNKLPWRLPGDMKFFRETTTGHPVLMGRKTYESIGRPLPNRTNVVLTRNPSFQAEGVTVMHSPEEAVKRFGNREIFVIGGAEIFRRFMPLADKLILTRIHHEFEVDAYFPDIPAGDWRLVSRQPGAADEHNPCSYEFEVYERAGTGERSLP